MAIAAEILEPARAALGLATSLAVGGLVGLERERRASRGGPSGPGGARTFPLVALAGALAALVGGSLGSALLVVGALVVPVLFFLADRDSAARAREPEAGAPLAEATHPGLTAALAGLVVFLLGALPFVPVPGLAFPARLLLEGALGTVVVALLALRVPLHAFAARLSEEDVLATVRFALVALVVLPLLPDRSLDPLGALNPFRIGVVIVLIAGISFAGYVTVRLFGTRRGLGVTALAGGLVSSTAVTLTFAPRARHRPALAQACAMAIVLASAVLFPRVLFELAVVRPSLARAAALPLAAMLATSALGGLVLWRRSPGSTATEEPSGLQNPFRLLPALRLGLVYAVIRLAVAAAWDRLGEGGLLVSAAVSGLADVDAITISIGRMHEDGLATDLAVAAVTIAAISNTLVKAGLAMVLGGARVGVAVAAVLVPAAGAGVACAWWWG